MRRDAAVLGPEDLFITEGEARVVADELLGPRSVVIWRRGSAQFGRKYIPNRGRERRARLGWNRNTEEDRYVGINCNTANAYCISIFSLHSLLLHTMRKASCTRIYWFTFDPTIK